MSDFDKNLQIADKDISKAIALFFVCITLLFMMIPKKDEGSVDISGEMIIQMSWDDKSKIDVDLWAMTPEDSPVYFMRKNGESANLLRDDMGDLNDKTGINYEIMTVYNPIPGKYSINAEIYQYNGSSEKEIEVQITVLYTKKNGSKQVDQVIRKTLSLEKDQKTFLNFTLDSRGFVIKETLNDRPTLMKTWNGVTPGEEGNVK